MGKGGKAGRNPTADDGPDYVVDPVSGEVGFFDAAGQWCKEGWEDEDGYYVEPAGAYEETGWVANGEHRDNRRVALPLLHQPPATAKLPIVGSRSQPLLSPPGYRVHGRVPAERRLPRDRQAHRVRVDRGRARRRDRRVQPLATLPSR